MQFVKIETMLKKIICSVLLFSVALQCLLFAKDAAPINPADAGDAVNLLDKPLLSDGSVPEHLRWFADAKYGMFIHFGLFSVAGGVYKGNRNHAEWYLKTTGIPVSEYEKFADQFDPERFDADAWAQVAEDAGMKYVCITSMHHDGFAMWPSKVSDRDNWSLSRTPFGKGGRDLLMELKKACEKRGIKFCLYHTIMDWHSPYYGNRLTNNDVAVARGIQPDMDKFQAYLEASVTEEIERYHPAMLWFDGYWDDCWTQERGEHLLAAIHKADPAVIVNDRLNGGKSNRVWGHPPGSIGDFKTPEQLIPAEAFPKGIVWESCMTMSGNGKWGFTQTDWEQKSVKPKQALLYFMFDIAAKGGNYLLNVGPTPEGEIPYYCVDRLREMGQWLRINGEAIYGSQKGIFTRQPAWGRTTTKRLPGGGTRVYAIVFNRPADGLLWLTPLNNEPIKAELLDGGGKLTVAKSKNGVCVRLPESLNDAKDFVVVVDVAGEATCEPDLAALQGAPPVADPDGVITLMPHQAEMVRGIELQGNNETNEWLGNWWRYNSTATWKFKSEKAQTCRLEINYGVPRESVGDVLEFVIGKQTVDYSVSNPSAGWNQMKTDSVGNLEIPAGEISLVARIKKHHGWGPPCNLGPLRIVPVK